MKQTRPMPRMLLAAALVAGLVAPAGARIGGTVEEFQRDFTRQLQLKIQDRSTTGLPSKFDLLLAYSGPRGSFLAAKVGLKKGQIVSQSVLLGVPEGDREKIAQAVTLIAAFFQEAAGLGDKDAYKITGAMMKQVLSGTGRATTQARKVRLTLAALPAIEGTMWHAMAER